MSFAYIPVNFWNIKYFFDVKYKYNLSPIRYFSDNNFNISNKKNHINASKEFTLYYTVSDMFEIPNNFKIFMGIGYEDGEYHYEINRGLYNEQTYYASDYAEVGEYQRNVRLQNINEEQVLKIEKIILPKFEFLYKFEQKILGKIQPSFSFFVGFNQLKFKSIDYKSTADGYYSGILGDNYFNEEIYDSHNLGVHNFGGYVINSGDFESLGFVNDKVFMISYGLDFSFKFNKILSFKFGLENSKYSGDVFQFDNIEIGQPLLSGDNSELNSLNNIIKDDELRFFTFNFGFKFKF